MGRAGLRVWLARALSAGLILSLVATGWTLARNPFAAPLVERSQQELAAALARLTADSFDAETLAQAVEAALAGTPTNWPLIDSLQAVARAQGLTLPPDLAQRVAQRRADETAPLALAGNCARCLAGDASCRQGAALPCLIGIELVPVVSDGRILVLEAANAATGRPVDYFNVALASVGLVATLGIVVTVGSSAAIKAATSLLRVARKVGALSAGLTRTVATLGRRVIRLDRVPRRGGRLDLRRLGEAFDPAALRALTTLAGDLGTLPRVMPPAQAIRVLRHIDGAADARRTARVAEVAGPRTLALFHVAGKSRLLRATLKLARAALDALILLAGTLLQLLAWLATRLMRRTLRA